MDCSPSIRPLDGSNLSELALKDGYDLLFSVAKPGAIELLQQHLDRIPDATNLSAIAADLVQDNLLGLGMCSLPELDRAQTALVVRTPLHHAPQRSCETPSTSSSADERRLPLNPRPRRFDLR